MLHWTDEQFITFLKAKYADSFKALDTHVFSFKDFRNVYAHQNYDGATYPTRNRVNNPVKPNQTLSKYVTQNQGQMKLSLAADVNIVVVEQEKLEKIVNYFIEWRTLALAG